jgi:hypothetical protein
LRIGKAYPQLKIIWRNSVKMDDLTTEINIKIQQWEKSGSDPICTYADIKALSYYLLQSGDSIVVMYVPRYGMIA